MRTEDSLELCSREGELIEWTRYSAAGLGLRSEHHATEPMKVRYRDHKNASWPQYAVQFQDEGLRTLLAVLTNPEGQASTVGTVSHVERRDVTDADRCLRTQGMNTFYQVASPLDPFDRVAARS